MLSDPHEYVVITPIMERYLYLKTVTLIKDISRLFFFFQSVQKSLGRVC